MALGLALSLGAGLAPLATATAAPASSASDAPGDLAARLGSLQREKGATRTPSPAGKASGIAAALPPTGQYFRLAGANRYATAVAVSQDLVCGPTEPSAQCSGLGGVDAPVDVVFVASGVNYPDALGAGPLATGFGPLLLVPPTGTLPAVVANEIDRINPTDIVILGGTGAVSTGIADQLGTHGLVSRIAGANRYDTASGIALLNDDILRNQDQDGDGVPDNLGTQVIVLASGQGFADALSGGGAAANSWGSLLLTAKAALPAETAAALQTINPPKVIILGGTGVVSTAVENAVKAAVPTSTVTRAAGSDRFGTAIALSQQTFTAGAPEVFLVNGFNFPDALASAPSAGFWGASTLLTRATCVTPGTRTEASRLNALRATAFGGTAVVSDNALHLGTTC